MIELPVQGTCFGFAVRAPFALRYLRDGGGDPLAVSSAATQACEPGELLGDWQIPGERPSHARLFADGAGYRLWIDVAGWYAIDPAAPSIVVPADEHPVRREERLWGIPALLCFRERGDLPLHAAALQVDGEAILLAAPRTFGKTTTAAGFVRAGHRLLSEDLTCVRLDGEPAVVPGPAVLRLRADVAEHLELPVGRRLEADDSRIRIVLDEDARGDCTPVPIRGIVFLRPGEDPTSLTRAPAPEAIRDLHALSFRLQTPEDTARCFAGVAALGAQVPAWNLAFTPSFDGLDEVVERIAAGV